MPLPGPVACREASPDGRAPPRPKRTIHRYRRFPFYDYSRGAALFITISTSPRACLFGRVVEAKMELSPLGVASLWQQGCHDRICTSERFIDSTERYIAYNPLKWELGKNQPAFLRIREPLNSPRLDPAEYWRGVGNVDLLDPSRKILSLRVSRKVRDHSRLLSRMKDASRSGYTILSGFISPGEVAVRDMLLADPAGRLIRILPDRMALGHRPESRYLPAIQERRYLEIAEGNEPTGFTRAACLDLNAAIIHIATEGEGLAVYWKEEGPTILGEGGASPSGLPATPGGASPSGLPATPGGASPSGLPATPGIKEQNGTSIDERDRP